MRLLNKKGYVSTAPLFITGIIVFIITVYGSWLFNPNRNEINFWSFLVKVSMKVALVGTIFIVGTVLIISIISAILEYIHSRKDWLKYYEDKVSNITIKLLIEEITDYELIKEIALEIYNQNSDGYIVSHILNSNDFDELYLDEIEKERLYEENAFKKFVAEIPSLINKINKIEFVSFEENNYSVLKELSFQFNFIDINKDKRILYEFDENIKEVVNSRIMNTILENNSKEYILAYTMLYLFFGNDSF